MHSSVPAVAARWTVFCLVLALCAVAILLAWRSQVAAPGTAASRPPASKGATHLRGSREPTVALFIGDSYSAGAAGVLPTQTFPCLTAEKLGWACNLDAQGGTGYVANGHENSHAFTRYSGRLKQTRALFTADVIIVSGGRNDMGKPADERRASLAYFRAVTRAYPHSRLVVLSPFWVNDGTPPAQVQSLRQRILESSKAVGATYIVTDGWLRPKDIGKDGVHPTVAGHRHLAAELAAALRRANRHNLLGHLQMVTKTSDRDSS